MWIPSSCPASQVPKNLVLQEVYVQEGLGPQAWPPGTAATSGHAVRQDLAELGHLLEATMAARLWRASSPQLHRLLAGHRAGPQAHIMLISQSPSSGASLEVLVLSQIRSELIPFLQRTPVAK